MKLLFFVSFIFISTVVSAQQPQSQVQAKKGVFTEQLYLNETWIDHILTNLSTTESLYSVLATGKSIADSLKNTYIHNQFSFAQPANIWLLGHGIFGSHNSYKDLLSSNYPAPAYITQGALQHGLSVQRSSFDLGGSNIVLFKNKWPAFNPLNSLTYGDAIGSILFSGISGNNSTVTNTMNIYGFVERAAPTYLSSGFIFNTTDTSGVYTRRMGINAKGNLMIGNATINPYQLNVASGDVRFNSLSGYEYDDVLAGSDNNGVVKQITLGDNIYFEDNTLNVLPHNEFPKYVALLSQTGQNNPTAVVLENTMGNVTWSRTATGNYSFNTEAFGYFWITTEASDENGNVVSTHMFTTGYNKGTLIVKNNTLSNTDGWKNISVEIRYMLMN
jgi:hypothetical protein